MSFGEAIKSVFSKYATFSGRARRSEYWYFFLFNFLVSLVLTLLSKTASFFNILNSIFSLAVFIPGIAVAVRRLHDIGKSGWYYLLPMIPSVLLAIFAVIAIASGSEPSSGLLVIIGIFAIITLALGILMLVWFCRDSEPGTNQYGPNPKETPNSDPAATVY